MPYSIKQEQVHVLMWGFGSVGKTTILQMRNHGEVSLASTPTIDIDLEKMVIGKVTMTAWDAGGRTMARPLWRQYYRRVKAVIFVVDSSDRNGIDQAREELHRMANDDELKHKSILIFANKQDLPNVMTPDEVRNQLALTKLDANTQWHFQAASAVQNQGIREGFEWLANIFMRKTDVMKSIVETLNDSMMIKNDFLSVLSLTNLKKLWNKFVQ